LKLRKFAAIGYTTFIAQQNIHMNIMQIKWKSLLRNYATPRTENDVTQRVSKYQLISRPKLDKFQSQCYSKCSKQNVQNGHSFPCSNADVCTTDRQHHRSLSLNPVKASSPTRQRASGAHHLK